MEKQATVRVTCPSCGDQELPASSVRLGVEHDTAFWICPSCEWVRGTDVDGDQIDALAGAGVRDVADGQEEHLIEELDLSWNARVPHREFKAGLKLLEIADLCPADLGCYA